MADQIRDMITCPICGKKSSVIDTGTTRYDGWPTIWRRRKCKPCDYIIGYTIEIPKPEKVKVNQK
jgi:transcriptional regulator NrdR family protein